MGRANAGSHPTMTVPSERPSIIRSYGNMVHEIAKVAQQANVGDPWLSEFLMACRSGGRGRTGVLSGDISYQVHGAGACFNLSDGREIDVDVDPASGEAIFDLWRLKQFARSCGLSATDRELESGLADGTASGDLRVVRPGWYALSTEQHGLDPPQRPGHHGPDRNLEQGPVRVLLPRRWLMHGFGFFRDDHDPQHSVRVAAGEQADRDNVVGYLSRGELLVGSPGVKPCLMGDDELVEIHVLTDGEWFWPAELPHYVECHAVVVPDAFLSRMRSLDYRVPSVDQRRLEEIAGELLDP
jgi:hypothetical protein